MLILCFVLFLQVQFIISLPVADPEITSLYQDSKPDVAPASPQVRQLPLGYMPPYLGYPFIKPGKIPPFMYPYAMDPFFNPYLSPLAPATPAKPVPKPSAKRQSAVEDSSEEDPTPSPTPPASPSKFFKEKKKEFMDKLYAKLTNATEAPVDKRAVTPTAVVAKPKVDPAVMLSKKYDFLAKLFKVLNGTAATPELTTTEEPSTTTTVKPTIVPPDFWAPFPLLIKPTKAPKPPKPSKAPKESKPSKTSFLSDLTLEDLINNPAILDSFKRAVPVPPVAAKKPVVPLDYYIPPYIDPVMYQEKVSAYLDKLFKKLNKTVDGDGPDTISPKATSVPPAFWNPTTENSVGYSSKLDAFLDLLFKSINVTDTSSKPKIVKREAIDDEVVNNDKRSFFDDLFNYNPSATTAAPSAQPITVEESEVNARSLGKIPLSYMMPPYVYNAKMAMYLDAMADDSDSSDSGSSKRATVTEKQKFLDEIAEFMKSMDMMYNEITALNSAVKDTTVISKRSPTVKPSSAVPPVVNVTGLEPKDAVLTLILADLGFLKDNLIDTFTEAVKSQKATAATTPAPKGKAKAPPIWAKFKATTTEDPLVPVQKRIDLINDVFTMLSQVQTELITGTVETPKDPPPSLLQLIQMISDSTEKPSKATIVPPSFWLPDMA